MIQALDYDDARMTAIQLLANNYEYIKSINIKYSEKDKCFWIERENWDVFHDENPYEFDTE